MTEVERGFEVVREIDDQVIFPACLRPQRRAGEASMSDFIWFIWASISRAARRE